MRVLLTVLCLYLASCAMQPTKEQRDALNAEFSRLVNAAHQGKMSWRLAIAVYKSKTQEITPYASGSQLGQYLDYLSVLAARLDNKEITPDEAQILAIERKAEILGQSAQAAQTSNTNAAAAMLLFGSAIIQDQANRKPKPPIVCQSTVFGGVMRSTCN
jgi:hypothetical protein